MQGGSRGPQTPNERTQTYQELLTAPPFEANVQRLSEALTLWDGHLTVATLALANPGKIADDANRLFLTPLQVPSRHPVRMLNGALAHTFARVLASHNRHDLSKLNPLTGSCFRFDDFPGVDSDPAESKFALSTLQLDADDSTNPFGRTLIEARKVFPEVVNEIVNTSGSPDYFTRLLLRKGPYLDVELKWGSATISTESIRGDSSLASQIVDQLRRWSVDECITSSRGGPLRTRKVAIGVQSTELQVDLRKHSFRLGLGAEYTGTFSTLRKNVLHTL